MTHRIWDGCPTLLRDELCVVMAPSAGCLSHSVNNDNEPYRKPPGRTLLPLASGLGRLLLPLASGLGRLHSASRSWVPYCE